jgi:hypothetical protein
MRYIYLVASCMCVGLTVGTQPGDVFVTDLSSPELQALARPMVLDESKYGCGPLRQPGQTYYVSLRGDDNADGRSWAAAWRTIGHGVSRLKAGDTLVIAEGEYFEPYLKIPCEGEPGRHVTVTAAPRQRVVLTGAVRLGPFRKTPGTCHTFEAAYRLDPRPKGNRYFIAAWESDTRIQLQDAGAVARVDELPGTFCYDAVGERLYVRFSDPRGPQRRAVAVFSGILTGNRDIFGAAWPHVEVSGSYVRLKGLQFQFYHSGLALRGADITNEDGSLGPYPRSYRGGHHITVEQCAFSSTDLAGLVISQGAQWNLVKGNYGALNGERGSILIHHQHATDNLYLHNWLDSSAPTVRSRGHTFHYGISYYLGLPSSRNHIIGNTLNDGLRAFRSKCLIKESVIQGNVMLGEFYTTGDAGKRTEADRVLVRNNVLLGPVSLTADPQGPGGPGGNWAGARLAFLNNFAPPADGRQQAVEAARFADPAYVDYRLQSDSPLLGAALGGGDLGAFRQPAGRILYVAPKGNDTAAGTSERLAWRTLRKAAERLRPGDTLYVAQGDYGELLVIKTSGKPDQPIRVRALGKQRVALPGIIVSGSNVTVEGFTMAGSAGDGITVRGNDVTLRECLLEGNAGAGVKADGAKDMNVCHCTLVGNGTGLVLDRRATGAAVRDSLFVSNQTAPMSLSKDAHEGYLGGGNAYFGPGVDDRRVATESGSIVGDPLFADASRRDYRLRWDSPAAYLGAFARPAGAFAVLHRTPQIDDAKAANIRPDSAVIAWTTPQDDTTGRVAYRAKGASQWSFSVDPEQGTVHAVGLANLKPGAEYEFQVEATGRRGGDAKGRIVAFKTTTQTPPPATYYLSPDGSDDADGRSPQTAWRTTRKANAEVGPGDTVLLSPGEYHHPVAPLTGGKPGLRITYRRHGDGEAIIQGDGAVAPLVLLPSKSYVTLDGLVFAGTPPAGGTHIMISGAAGVELLNCRVGHKRREGGFGHCIMASSCTGLRVEGNVIWGARYHVTASGCTDTLIRNNTFTFGQVFSLNLGGKHTGTKVLNNIFYCATSVANAQVALSPGDNPVEIQSDHNLFFSNVKGYKIGAVYGAYSRPSMLGETLREWQEKSGLDKHSVQADPMFVNAASGDFRLQPGSPAIGRGQNGRNIGALGVAQ